MIARLKELTPLQIWLLLFFILLAAIESVLACVGLLLNVAVGYGDLLIGFAGALLATLLVGKSLAGWLAGQQAASQPPGTLTEETAPPAKEEEMAESLVSHAAPQEPLEAAPPQKEVSGVRQAIRNLDVLPAMPVIAQRLLTLRLDTDAGEQELLKLVGQDAQISAKLVGLANSALVGATRQIRTVREASLLLGSKRVQSVATGIAIISLMARKPVGEFNVHDLWLHSIRVAFAMQGIARAMPPDRRPQDDQVLLAGMLHDIGYLVQAYLDPHLSDRLHNRLAAEPERPAIEVEREFVDISHDELGAELASHWNLPEEIVAVLRYHHNPDVPEAAAGQPLVRMINIAEKLLPSLGLVEYVAPDVGAEEWDALGIDSTRAEEVKAAVDEQAEQAMQLADSFT